MFFSGIVPNVLNISLIEKKGEDLCNKTQYFNYKETFQFILAPKMHHEKICLQ
jgi:hypothetical protein